jgi:hypothetical protein
MITRRRRLKREKMNECGVQAVLYCYVGGRERGFLLSIL